MAQVTWEDFVGDLKTVVADVQDLLDATAGQTSERIEAARAKTGQSLAISRARLERLGHRTQARARHYAHEVDERVHNNAWTAVGVAAGAALVLGMLVGRRVD